jgi:hypothetical protein
VRFIWAPAQGACVPDGRSIWDRRIVRESPAYEANTRPSGSRVTGPSCRQRSSSRKCRSSSQARCSFTPAIPRRRRILIFSDVPQSRRLASKSGGTRAVQAAFHILLRYRLPKVLAPLTHASPLGAHSPRRRGVCQNLKLSVTGLGCQSRPVGGRGQCGAPRAGQQPYGHWPDRRGRHLFRRSLVGWRGPIRIVDATPDLRVRTNLLTGLAKRIHHLHPRGASFALIARARTPHLERNGIANADCAQRAESSLTVRGTMPARRDCR